MLLPCFQYSSGADIKDLHCATFVTCNHNAPIASDVRAVCDIIESGYCFGKLAGSDGEELDPGAGSDREEVGGLRECIDGGRGHEMLVMGLLDGEGISC